MTGPRILVWDIENSPAVGEFWGSTYNTNIIRVIRPSSVICFAAKWLDERKIQFYSDFHDGHQVMLEAAHRLLDEADAVVSYNGGKHDTPHITTELQTEGFTPVSPFVETDLYKVAKRSKFQKNSLDFVSQHFGIGQKVRHAGHQLWVDVGNGDAKAWNRMRLYNIGDVRLTERLYHRVLPWTPQSLRVNYNLWVDGDCCDRCGSRQIQWRGTRSTSTSSYPRYQCQKCGGWGRGKKATQTINLRGA